MSLFEVKGWNVPSQATLSPSQPSRKRKRPAKDAAKVEEAQVNVEKLMRKVEKTSYSFESRNEQKRKRKEQKRNGNTSPTSTSGNQEIKSRKKRRVKPPKQRENSGNGVESAGQESKQVHEPTNTLQLSKRARKKGSQVLFSGPSPHLTNDTTPASTHSRKASNTVESSSGLTSLQSRMKGRLDGARFRWINEVLYTTGSIEGHRLMREDPKLYEEYHAGFRQQVRTWPSNPVDYYITMLSSYPNGTVIVDLGCGDAALARSLVPKGYCVLSFDLMSDGAYVLEADVCEKIPLPGSEDELEDENGGQIVNICVCALSLMSLDWIRCIRETWRILRHGGELKIAEVTSRFTDVDEFIAVIGELGFKLKSKDDSNTHFTLFEFRKSTRAPLNTKKWNDLQAKHEVLKPCEYKRR